MSPSQKRTMQRRLRRWKRRIRHVSPILCLPLLLGTLMLSVDLIEYRADPIRVQGSDLPVAPPAKTLSLELEVGVEPVPVSSHSVVEPEIAGAQGPETVSPEAIARETQYFDPTNLHAQAQHLR